MANSKIVVFFIIINILSFLYKVEISGLYIFLFFLTVEYFELLFLSNAKEGTFHVIVHGIDDAISNTENNQTLLCFVHLFFKCLTYA